MVSFAGLDILGSGTQSAGRKLVNRDDSGGAWGVRSVARSSRAIKPDRSFTRTTRGRWPLRRNAPGGPIGSRSENTPRKREPEQSGRHLVIIAATHRHHPPLKHVLDLAGLLRQRQQSGELTIMPRPIDPSRDLLFGLLALQNGLIDQVQLVAAFQSWTRDKSRPLAVHLVGRGDLDAEQRAGVEAMVALHLKKHGGDAENSLAAIPVGRATREKLAGLGDPQIDASLARVGSGSGSTETDDDFDRTPSYAVGTATSDGQRFRVLRPHARGGLGAVFVALDTELHREVALKRILDDHADDPTSRQRFLLEAEVTGGLEHPGIVPVYGLGTYGDGRPYYAMRFIRGDSLKEAIEHFHADPALQTDPGRRSLELHKLLRRFIDVCNAIDYAHCSRRVASRHQAGQCAGGQARRDADHGLGSGQAHGPIRCSLGRADASAQLGQRQCRDAAGQRAGHAGLHEPRAGRGRPRPTRATLGRLQPGSDTLLLAHRPPALRGRRHRRHPARRAAGRLPRRPARSTPRSTGRWRRSASRPWP